MKRSRRTILAAVAIVVAVVLAYLLGAGTVQPWNGAQAPVPPEEWADGPEWHGSESPTHPIPGRSWVEVARSVSPAVVNVSARRGPETVEDFFRRFFEGLPPVPTPRPSLGSGFIVSADGEIVTNAHVVRGAADIVVRMMDGSEHRASVMGVDTLSDVALLRIEADQPLPTLALADSDSVLVGEPVLAVGNPFGLEQTVTAGIVSGTGRYIGAGPYDDFIQTDAAINPGNSGGPLLNEAGAVVGVNTAIVSPAGTWAGIGFAIPADLAREVLDRLRAEGRVVRGFLGVTIGPVTPDAARAAGLPVRDGALIVEVAAGGPADLAGLRTGDVIVAIDEQEVRRPRDLTRRVAFTRPDTDVELEVVRPGVGPLRTKATLVRAEPAGG